MLGTMCNVLGGPVSATEDSETVLHPWQCSGRHHKENQSQLPFARLCNDNRGRRHHMFGLVCAGASGRYWEQQQQQRAHIARHVAVSRCCVHFRDAVPLRVPTQAEIAAQATK